MFGRELSNIYRICPTDFPYTVDVRRTILLFTAGFYADIVQTRPALGVASLLREKFQNPLYMLRLEDVYHLGTYFIVQFRYFVGLSDMLKV